MRSSNPKKLIRKTLGVISVGLLGAFTLCVIVLNSSVFRTFLRNEICKQALNRSALHLDIGSVETRWRPLSLDLERVVVHGNEVLAEGEPPLFQAKRIEIGIQFWPLIHGNLRLRDLILDTPIVHIRIDSQGRSNLSAFQQQNSSRSGAGAVFDLDLQNCAIHAGELYYNDVHAPFSASFQDLKFKAVYNRVAAKYQGFLSYGTGRLSTPAVETFEHSTQLQFTASRSGFSVSPLTISSSSSRLTLNLRLDNYANPRIGGTYNGTVFTVDVAKALRLASLPVGEVALEGRFAYQARPAQSFLSAASVQGRMRSKELTLRTSQKPVKATAVSASYTLTNANLQLENLEANVFGGRLRADWKMLHIGASVPISNLEASIEKASLSTASEELTPRNVQRIHIVGIANANIRASWSGSADDAVAHLDLTVSSPQRPASSDIPLTGQIQAEYNRQRNTLSFASSYLQTGATRISIAGTLGSRRGAGSDINVLATTTDLRQVTSLAALVQSAMQPVGQEGTIPQLNGSANLNARVTGPANNPEAQGQLSAEHLIADRSRWRSLTLNFRVSSSALIIQNAALRAERQGEISFNARVGLHNWSLAANTPISLQAAMTNISLAEAEGVVQMHYPVSGTLSGRISVNGTKENPEGTATVALARGSAWNEPLNSLDVSARFQRRNIHATANVQAPAGKMSAEASYALATQEYDVTLSGANIALEKIVPIQRFGRIAGTLDISAKGRGTMQDPQLQATIAIPRLTLGDQVISGIDTQVIVSHQHANIALRSVVDQGAMEAKATVDLAGDKYATASVDVRDLPIAAVLANFLPGQHAQLKGETEVHLAMNGPLSVPSRVEAHLEVPKLTLAYADAQIALARPLHADYRSGVVSLQPTGIQGTGLNLTFGGTIPIDGQAPYAISADGSLDLSVLQKFAPDVRSSGQMEIHVGSKRGSAQPSVVGQLQIKNAVFSAEALPLGIERLDAQINLSGNRADIAKFSGNVGGGTISATGFVSYGRKSTFDVALDARSLRIRYPEGLRSNLSGRLNLQGSPDDSTLTGTVLVDRLSFTQAFDLARFAGTFSEDSTDASPRAFASRMKMNVKVQSAQDLNLTSSKLSMEGSANLDIAGTPANPVLLGRIALTGGELFFLGKRFEVENGTIQFANPVRTEPVANLYVTTTVEQYKVTLKLSGPFDRLQTTYTSDPSLPPADIIHLLAFGNTSAEGASAPSSSAAMGAESVLAQGVSSQVTGKLENLAGISQLTIDPLATNSQGNPGAQVAIQQRVTGSLLLTLSTDVTSTQNQSVTLQYQLNKPLSVTVLRDRNGGYGIDLRLHKVF